MLEMPEMLCARRKRLGDGYGVTKTISFTAKLVSAVARLAESSQSLMASTLWKRGEIGMVGTEKADLGRYFTFSGIPVRNTVVDRVRASKQEPKPS
ncbi:hypothetical protein F5144DRAFT_166344 [Chaetomium tenue]|uniref:Uncharacterized protein n=1 Tax=Chaetomium tenue TaxID=1854479 RepID=A0ACB7PGF2_9PEZI|nr:hypothetical protein F5144DRAFT_166344 [Chaetomium globosum]